MMFSAKTPNINQLWANLIVEELIRCGVRQFVLSPGYRCTPLTVAAAKADIAEVITHFDERGAAYYALGHARATGKPAALVCTSGTATANYFPAVVEASMDMVPMVLLTADRPVELRDTGANQTIDQVELYGRYVRYSYDLPVPDEEISPESVLAVINEAVDLALHSPQGPVHVNCQYREPLAPTSPNEQFAGYLSRLGKWLNDDQPFIKRQAVPAGISDSLAESVATVINRAASGLLVTGPFKDSDDTVAVKKLAEQLQWPVFADIRSGLRLGANLKCVISHFDQLLLSEKYFAMKANVVLHLGGVMTSKRYNEFVQHCRGEHYIQVADHSLCRDPNNVVTERVVARVADFCGKLTELLNPDSAEGRLDAMMSDNESVGNMIRDEVESNAALTEIAVARLVSRHASGNSGLFLGSSMPIRDMNSYAAGDGPPIGATANRGASGIDGSIATAVGWAAGRKTPVTAVIGDLAFLHDVNSLMLMKNNGQPVTLIVINNNGGGIFSLLPIHDCGDVFEKYFGTPHNLSFERITGAFDLDYYRPESTGTFVRLYEQAQKSKRPSVIEIVTNREENREAHFTLQNKIKALVDTGKK
ncbi:MAG: 2-succinyl-5-enolpyruvyl-6-hydroxy-3-cyclohexene-1-carboxylic-acid synthase [Candidatus Zixiibacteriota bacterium]|nr:MAG: 2-succinyl-5-enolpyruvyl-6-hydroxy-3-cyclohexene-1-carboxylic-acid synthase [candidate division Zixibacteria bacterium]